jgi:uncharacterized protein YjiS (DUF1127 family)
MSSTVHHPLINYQAEPASRTRRPLSLSQSIARTLRLWRNRMRERRTFPLLEERDLHDLGLSRWDVERELAKPFWRG